MAMSDDPVVAVVHPWATPLVAVIVLVVAGFVGNALISGNDDTERPGAVVAGLEATANGENAPAGTEVGEGALSLTDVTSPDGPVSELMADLGAYQGRFFVVSSSPGSYPVETGRQPRSDTIHVFDGAGWTSIPLTSADARSFLLPEEIAAIRAGGPYNVGFLGDNYGVEAARGEVTYRIREPSLQSQRARLTALVAQDGDGVRTEQTLPDMLYDSPVDSTGHIMSKVAAGPYGIVVITDGPTVDGAVDHLLVFSPDGERWEAADLGPVETLGVLIADNAFLVLGSYGDERVYSEPSPVYLGRLRSADGAADG